MTRAVTAVLKRPRHFALESRELPAPGRHELLVRIAGSGVCGSDLDRWRGRPWFDYPSEPGRPGHEGWGAIETAGEHASLEPGTRVALLSDRCFADAAVVAEADVVPLPDDLEDSPVPGEALGCAFNVVRMAGIASESRVAVVGAGFLGTLVTALSHARGARVVVFSRRAHSRRLASRMGAVEALPLEAAPEGEASFDIVVEATGAQAGLDYSTPLVAPGGRLVIAGYHQDGPRQVDMRTWNWNGIELVNAHVRDSAQRIDGVREAVEAMASGLFDPSPLYSHRFALEDLDDAFAALASRPSGFTKALVTV